MVADFPSLSIRKAALAVGVSPTLTYSIYTDDLHLSADKFHIYGTNWRTKIMKKGQSLPSGSLINPVQPLTT